MSTKNKYPIAWDSINWKSVKHRIRRVQFRIFKASYSGNKNKVYWLQDHLVHSIDAKLIAIQKIIKFHKNLNNEEKLSLVQNLKIDGKVSIEKRKKSHLDFSTIQNQAKQVLVRLALEPEWEAKFEPNSYGYRPDRNLHNAIQAIYQNLGQKNRKWIYKANIREYMNTMDPDSLLKKINTYPKMELQIRNWFTQGLVTSTQGSSTQRHPSQPPFFDNIGLSQKRAGQLMEDAPSSYIKPLFVNIALHGLESYLKDFVENRTLQAPSLIRYGYEFVIIHESKEIILLCINETQRWFFNRLGVDFDPEQFFLKDGTNGFYFLDFQIIQIQKNNQYKVKIIPSKKSQTEFLLKIREILQKNKAMSSYLLIQKLRPVIMDWGNYFKFYDCKGIYRSLTNQILKKIRAWVFRRDTRSSRHQIKIKYFPENKTWIFNGKRYQSHWVLYGQRKGQNGELLENFLPHLSWFTSENRLRYKKASAAQARCRSNKNGGGLSNILHSNL